MKRKRIDIITLGCSKNLVDSEQLMRQLEEAGYSVTHDTENPEGEIAVINTCGFIGDAKEESINMILEFAERKEKGDLMITSTLWDDDTYFPTEPKYVHFNRE